MRHLFDKPLGAVSAPFGSSFKCDPWTAIAAGISAASSFVQNQINAERASTDMATYLNLVKKQRDWQKEDQQWSEDYSKRLLDYQNLYNTPSAQMERFKQAGLNPYALMNNEGAIGSGNSQSIPSPNPSTRSAVSPFQRPPLDNPLNSAADKIFASSSIRSQRIDAMAKFADSLPALVKSVGKTAASRIAGALFGQDIDMSRIDSMIQNEALQSNYRTEVDRIQSEIAVKYGDKEAANRVALQEQNFNKMAAEIGLMASNGKLNDQMIITLMSEYVRNMADAWKLRKEGNYYVASAETINALRGLTVASLNNEVTKSGFENRIKGYYEGSGLDNYLSGSHHSEKTGDVLRIQENKSGSELVQAMDLVFGKWLKVSSSY